MLPMGTKVKLIEAFANLCNVRLRIFELKRTDPNNIEYDFILDEASKGIETIEEILNE